MIEYQRGHSMVSRDRQLPPQVPHKEVVLEPFYRLDPALERSFDPSMVDQGHIHEIDAPRGWLMYLPLARIMSSPSLVDGSSGH